jgi:hypothetical protein
MNTLSEITKDYLADIEILTEAKEEFDQQMEKWWTAIFTHVVIPALQTEHSGSPDIWENKAKPGKCHWRAASDDPIYLEIVDPRSSHRPFYTVSVRCSSQPILRDLAAQEALVSNMNRVAIEQKAVDSKGLNWKQREMLSEDIEIIADDLDETGREVCDVAVRFCRIVLEYARVTKLQK